MEREWHERARAQRILQRKTGRCPGWKTDQKELEAHASSASSGSVAGSLQAPYFYTASNEARVNLVMEIPPSSVEFNKIKGNITPTSMFSASRTVLMVLSSAFQRPANV